MRFLIQRVTSAKVDVEGKTVGAYTAECSDAVLGANDPQQLEELNQIAKAKGYNC